MLSETELIFKRAKLHALIQAHPHWTAPRLARATGMSVSWVRKWRRRRKEMPVTGLEAFKSHARRPKTIHRKVTPALEALVLAIRDDPPDGYSVCRAVKPFTTTYRNPQRSNKGHCH